MKNKALLLFEGESGCCKETSAEVIDAAQRFYDDVFPPGIIQGQKKEIRHATFDATLVPWELLLPLNRGEGA